MLGLGQTANIEQCTAETAKIFGNKRRAHTTNRLVGAQIVDLLAVHGCPHLLADELDDIQHLAEPHHALAQSCEIMKEENT